MRGLRVGLSHQEGIATTEFIVVAFIFILFLALFNVIGKEVLFKIKSLIAVRNLAFHRSETIDPFMGQSQRETVLMAQTPAASLDKCFSPYLMIKPSRIKTQVRLKPGSFFKNFVPLPGVSDQFLMTEDSWKNIPPFVLGSLASRCPG
ncbi:MAG: hypothetical protein ACYDBV_03685 [Nitrospiria bacterium]